jgi:hypothetical protein
MIQVLGDLDAEGFFGTGEDRGATTLFCSVSDSDFAEWLEEESACRLNPVPVYERFSAR